MEGSQTPNTKRPKYFYHPETWKVRRHLIPKYFYHPETWKVRKHPIPKNQNISITQRHGRFADPQYQKTKIFLSPRDMEGSQTPNTKKPKYFYHPETWKVRRPPIPKDQNISITPRHGRFADPQYQNTKIFLSPRDTEGSQTPNAKRPKYFYHPETRKVRRNRPNEKSGGRQTALLHSSLQERDSSREEPVARRRQC
jgi:hypothetical protein